MVYDCLSDIINASKARLNDRITTLAPITGRLLDNNQAFTQRVCNTAWRKLQDFLCNLGFMQLTDEDVLFGLPAVASQDPAVQVRIDWFNYFDGQNLQPGPTLPPDLVVPLKCGERLNGSMASFSPMRPWVDGLPRRAKQADNMFWEWRADGLYLPGSLNVTDLYIRYKRYLSDFIDSGQTQWFQQPVPILRCQDALSYFICAEIEDAREDLKDSDFRAKGEIAAKLLVNRDISMKQRTNVRRRPRSGRGEGSYYSGGLWI
jgi:hypothetical protein